MSIIHEKSPKHCAEKQATKLKKKKLFLYVSTFFLSILSLILLVYFTLHPTNPHFSLTQANINHLNITLTPSFLNSSIHLTLLSTNPNRRIRIYYHRFLVHASYNTHLVTPDTSIPPFFQDPQQTNLVTASLLGNHLPADPSLAYQLQRDQAAGKLPLDFKITGSLRWKVGNWISRRYRFNVDCATVFPLGRKVSTSKQGAVCSTSI